VAHSAYPSPLGYSGFPKACCTSVNNVIAHGIPDEYVDRRYSVFAAQRAHVQSVSRRRGRCEHRYNRILRWVSRGHVANISGWQCGESITLAIATLYNTTIKDEAGKELVATTSEALDVGIAVCGPGQPFKSIGKAIHDLVDRRGYSVSSQFTGHGIGEVFHRSPWILHHRELSYL